MRFSEIKQKLYQIGFDDFCQAGSVSNCQCVLMSTFVVSFLPAGTVQTRSGCTVPAGAPLCGDCGNGLRFPPGQARPQRARLTDFCGAAAPQYQRSAPVSRVWGRHSPTSSRPGGQMSGAKFGPRVDTCSQPAELLQYKSMNKFF